MEISNLHENPSSGHKNLSDEGGSTNFA